VFFSKRVSFDEIKQEHPCFEKNVRKKSKNIFKNRRKSIDSKLEGCKLEAYISDPSLALQRTIKKFITLYISKILIFNLYI